MFKAELVKRNDDTKEFLIDFTEKIDYLDGLIRRWWDIDGFNLVKDISFLTYNLTRVKLGFYVGNYNGLYSESENPDDIKNGSELFIKKTEEQGFKLTDSKLSVDPQIIDCDSNRELIVNIIKNKFPSAYILEWESKRFSFNANDNTFTINSIEFNIESPQEMKALEDYVFKFTKIKKKITAKKTKW